MVGVESKRLVREREVTAPNNTIQRREMTNQSSTKGASNFCILLIITQTSQDRDYIFISETLTTRGRTQIQPFTHHNPFFRGRDQISAPRSSVHRKNNAHENGQSDLYRNACPAGPEHCHRGDISPIQPGPQHPSG